MWVFDELRQKPARLGVVKAVWMNGEADVRLHASGDLEHTFDGWLARSFDGRTSHQQMWETARAAASDALRLHHASEVERLYPLTDADRRPLPCSCVGDLSCNPRCFGMVCMFCGQDSLARIRNEGPSAACDVCPFRQQKVPAGTYLAYCTSSECLSSRDGASQFEMCLDCVTQMGQASDAAGLARAIHSRTCDSLKPAEQRWPGRHTLEQQQAGAEKQLSVWDYRSSEADLGQVAEIPQVRRMRELATDLRGRDREVARQRELVASASTAHPDAGPAAAPVPAPSSLLLKRLDRARLAPVGWLLSSDATDARWAYRGQIGYLLSSSEPAFIKVPAYKDGACTALAITQAAHPDGARSVIAFNPVTMEFDGRVVELSAESECCFVPLSPASATWAMALSAGLSTLESPHQAELERLHPLTEDDRRPLPCSCRMHCDVHLACVRQQDLTCLWCGEASLKPHYHQSPHVGGNVCPSDEEMAAYKALTTTCDVCAIQATTIAPADWRWRCENDSCDHGFDVCRGCAQQLARRCCETGCEAARHTLDCDSLMRPEQRWPERQELQRIQSLQRGQFADGRRYFPALGICADNQQVDTLTGMAELLEMHGVGSLAGTLRELDGQYRAQLAVCSAHSEQVACGRTFNASHLGAHKRPCPEDDEFDPAFKRIRPVGHGRGKTDAELAMSHHRRQGAQIWKGSAASAGPAAEDDDPQHASVTDPPTLLEYVHELRRGIR